MIDIKPFRERIAALEAENNMNEENNEQEISYEDYMEELKHTAAGRRILAEIDLLKKSNEHLGWLAMENYKRWQEAEVKIELLNGK